MQFFTNKEKGNAGFDVVIAYFLTNGYTVSIPVNDAQDYDLAVEKEGALKTVQIKATGCKTKYNVYQDALKSCGRTKGDTYKMLIVIKVDCLYRGYENVFASL